MSFSVVCGKLGAGKTSFAVSEAYRYLKQGRRVAANFALDFTSFKDVDPDSHVVVLSDIPVADDLISLGRGGPSEEKAGLLIIDEGLFCLNSRGWAGGDRQKLIEFFALTRKLGWDVILIIQHIQAMDKQIRMSFAETLVICQRLDKLKLLGFIPLPKIHLAVSRYGTEVNSPISDRTFFKPKTIGAAYDTNKLFDPLEKGGMYCTLTRRLAVLRYENKKPLKLSELLMLPIQFGMFIALAIHFKCTHIPTIKLRLAAAHD
ncbi:hypothetical protein JW897_23990 [Chromobacterium alkanivorans]|uniref:zonular occludens toxin domain-containing protein n=1 Tax=Chromobacterium alkanivorans TaxID=1071719 RepID=UPI00196874AD|nr:zonular occludens toxin domain-containing protein [Chromobacterium alkanivorans]MBN3006804.1 hypothetical protein [Chromobacterium alkanivorans]